MDSLDSKVEFDEAIKEIQLLILYASRNKKDFLKYAVFNKAALVLLCAKFESFLESFLQEYAFAHLTTSSNKTLDRDIYEHIVDTLIESLEPVKGNSVKRKVKIKEIVTFCSDKEIKPCTDFKVNPRLKLGKHGQNEIERLLKSFGFGSYLQQQPVQEFFAKFNSLNNIRNHIIHEDATPSLTHQDVEGYLREVQSFVVNLHTAGQLKISRNMN